MNRRGWMTAGLVTSSLMLAVGVEPASAATWRVANDGVDGPGCGSPGAPCRSISQALALAAPGDRIVVGPGRYGDLDGDGAVTSPGEEGASLGTCACLVHVDKAVIVESTHGAGATVIDGGGVLASDSAPSAPVSGVLIAASNATFGRSNRGFSILRASGLGVQVAPATAGVRVVDNVAHGNGTAGVVVSGSGFDVAGTGHVVIGNLASANFDCGFRLPAFDSLMTRNLSVANENDGFQIIGGGNRVTDNVARHNRVFGWEVFGAGSTLVGNLAQSNGASGFDMSGGVHTIRENVASDNGQAGFDAVAGTVTLVNNVAVGNRFGIRVTAAGGGPGGHVARENMAFGNRDAGIVVDLADVTLRWNSMAGNGHDPVAPNPPNCGMLVNVAEVTATQHYWGAPTGPGPDPADLQCGEPAVTTPFLAAPPSIPAGAGQAPTDP